MGILAEKKALLRGKKQIKPKLSGRMRDYKKKKEGIERFSRGVGGLFQATSPKTTSLILGAVLDN
jgi:hypothetical protein